MTVLLQNAAAGASSAPLNVKRLGDLLVTGFGTPGETVAVYVSGSTHQNDWILFGTITIGALGSGFLEKQTGTDIELNPFERMKAVAGGGNANPISAYLQTSH